MSQQNIARDGSTTWAGIAAKVDDHASQRVDLSELPKRIVQVFVNHVAVGIENPANVVHSLRTVDAAKQCPSDLGWSACVLPQQEMQVGLNQSKIVDEATQRI